jgi:hypothetical protein
LPQYSTVRLPSAVALQTRDVEYFVDVDDDDELSEEGSSLMQRRRCA